jgi:Chaperone of endosialidase
MCSPSAPDMSGQTAVANRQAALSEEQLRWMQQIYNETAPQRADAIRRANLISDQQLDSARQQDRIAADYDHYNRETFRPLEQGIVKEATEYDTPLRREQAAAEAQGNVGSLADATRGTAMREMAARGVDPSSGSSAIALSRGAIGQAAATAAAGNDARTRVETVGAAKKMDAASLGRGLASSQATSAGLALTAGNSSSNNAQVGGNVTAQGAQMINQGYAGAQGGLAGAAHTFQGITDSTVQANNANNGMWGAVGQVAGAYAGSGAGSSALAAFSDKNIKEDRKPVNPKTSLAAISKMPVDSWKYKRGSVADDGGKTHVGPMAQDMRKGLGDATAPGGKVIDLISANGHLFNAVKQLAKEVQGLKNARRHA